MNVYLLERDFQQFLRVKWPSVNVTLAMQPSPSVDWREGVKDNRIHPVVKESESVRSVSESAVNSFDMSINLNHMIYSSKLPLKIK